MTTTRMALEKLVAGVSTHANLISYFNSNTDIIDAYLAKSNWNAGALDPDADNDDSEGYAAGSRWYTTTAIWECVDASTGAAVWHQIWPALTTELSGSITNAQLAGSIADDKLANSYAILAGRTGGQTLKGDTASGGNLTLQSTAHATKGKIYLGSDYYDENSKETHLSSRLLIGDLDFGFPYHGITVSKSNGPVMNYYGQSADRCTGYGWWHNANPALAFAWLYTVFFVNPIQVDCSLLRLQYWVAAGVTIGVVPDPGPNNLDVLGTIKARGGTKYTLSREANISIASGEVQSYACPYGQTIEFANGTYGTTIAAGGFLVVT